MDIPRRVAQRAPQVDQVGDAGRRVVRPSIDSLPVELGDAGAACLRQPLLLLGAFSKVGCGIGDDLVGRAKLRFREPGAPLVVDHDVAMAKKWTHRHARRVKPDAPGAAWAAMQHDERRLAARLLGAKDRHREADRIRGRTITRFRHDQPAAFTPNLARPFAIQ